MPLHPDYLHVLLNPLPVYGLALGLVALIVAFCLRSRPARIVALAIICLSSIAAWPVIHYGEKAYDDVMMLTDKDGSQWMDEHESRAEKCAVSFYVLAALSLAAILAPQRWPKTDLPLSIGTLFLSVITFGLGSWIAYAGGRIRHEEFRTSPPPASQKAKDD